MINEKLFESLVRDYGDECVKITQNLINKAYQSGREDGAREFAEWLANGNTFIRRIGSEKMKTIDELLAEWKEEV